MLSKRTNILFDEKSWNALTRLAEAKKTSVGNLVRIAVNQSYFSSEKQDDITKAHDTIISIRFTKKTDYKKLIDYGRKY